MYQFLEIKLVKHKAGNSICSHTIVYLTINLFYLALSSILLILLGKYNAV